MTQLICPKCNHLSPAHMRYQPCPKCGEMLYNAEEIDV